MIYTLDTDTMRLVCVTETVAEAEAATARGTYNFYCFDDQQYLLNFNARELIMLLRQLRETPSFSASTPGAKFLAAARAWEALTSREKGVYI